MLPNWLTGRCRKSSATPRRRSCFRLECLEDRAVPATFYVNSAADTVISDDGKLSLREAITRANGQEGDDTVVLPAGVFKIASPGAENGNVTGDFDITGSVTIRGAGAGLTVIDGQLKDRAFDVIGDASTSTKVVLQGMTIRNSGFYYPLGSNGGGIQVQNAYLEVRDCAIVGNQSSANGGGIAAHFPADVTLLRSTVARNVAHAGGGGLYVGDVLKLNGSTVRGNVAGSSGGLYAGTATLTNSTVSGNLSSSMAGGVNTGTAIVTNSTIRGNTARLEGGGIYATSATMTGSTVRGNRAGTGGGAYFAGSATLTNCAVTGNLASGDGGGIRGTGTVTLTTSTVSDNTAILYGGGVHSDTAILVRSSVSDNSAGNNGGGVQALTLDMTRSTVSDNRAYSGGGIVATSATVTDSTISGNTARIEAGGIYANTATMTNCTIAGNVSGSHGGGIYATTATLLNCTVAENTARYGGGIWHAWGGVFSVRNTIVAQNLVYFEGIGPDFTGTDIVSAGHNLIGNGIGGAGFINGVNGDMVGTSNNPIDPRLGELRDNGGPTWTMALLAGSPAIDNGDDSGLSPTDQRGVARDRDGNGNGVAVVDIGAFERSPPLG